MDGWGRGHEHCDFSVTYFLDAPKQNRNKSPTRAISCTQDMFYQALLLKIEKNRKNKIEKKIEKKKSEKNR